MSTVLLYIVRMFGDLEGKFPSLAEAYDSPILNQASYLTVDEDLMEAAPQYLKAVKT